MIPTPPEHHVLGALDFAPDLPCAALRFPQYACPGEQVTHRVTGRCHHCQWTWPVSLLGQMCLTVLVGALHVGRYRCHSCLFLAQPFDCTLERIR